MGDEQDGNRGGDANKRARTDDGFGDIAPPTENIAAPEMVR